MLSIIGLSTSHEALGTLLFVVTIESQLDDISAPALSRFLQRARRAAQVSGQAHVLIVSNARIQTLNRKFRGKQKPTDVLSFPAVAEVADRFAGDIVISGDMAKANARSLGHPVAEELKVLMLHGLLHLGGHDHESDNGEMAGLELRLRKQLGLRDGLIERSVPRSASRAPRPSRRRR
ncbi:MAG: rRNA maturation RNase YbeY [Terriglobales bacterium]